MGNKKRKNYTLYLNLYGKEVEIIKGTLEEIDDFTTYFTDSSAMFRNLSAKLSTVSYTFYIKTSKGTKYDVIYYPHRSILFFENINSIMVKLRQLDKNKLLEYIKRHTDAVTYVNTPLAYSIPVVRLYKTLLTNSDYYAELDSYVKNNYKALRKMIFNIFSEEDLSDLKRSLDNNKKKEMIESFKDISKKIYEIYSSNKGRTHEDDELDDEKIEEYSNEERAFDILNNPLLTEEEKMKELDMIFDDSEEYNNFVTNYVYKSK